jgi:hypothetical protein
MNYSLHYINLILKAKDRSAAPDMERHHSVPKHWFVEGKTKKDYDFSVVFLTRREHFIAHRLLCKMFPDSEKAKLALLRMVNTKQKQLKYKVNNRVYDDIKEQFVSLIRQIRQDPIKDKKRREICSLKMQKRWAENRTAMMKNVLAVRASPNDLSRRKNSSEALKLKHKNGLTEKTKIQNKNLNHMTNEQRTNFSNGAEKYRESDAFKANSQKLKETLAKYIAVLDNDGNNRFITKEEYELGKGIKYHHVNSKRAKSIRSERDQKCN